MAGVRSVVGAVVLVAMVTMPGCLCSKPKPPPPPRPTVYELCLEGDPRLNWYNGTANTLYVRIFQLSAPDAFLSTPPEKLMERDVVVPGVEGSPQEKTVFPGSKVQVRMRQDPNALYVGVVAGYYDLQGTAKYHRELPLPPDEAEDDDEDDEKQPPAAPDCVYLGANGIGS